jgi:3-hydroxyisobutyrate dehydrogenase-like beta-hydroxyacid dehydrogenase
MSKPTVGFIGLGRLGSVLAGALVDAGYPMVCAGRGRSAELAAKGAAIAGDGSPRAVAEAAEIVLTCLPGDGFAAAFEGDDGVLAACSATLVVDLSTAPLGEKMRIRGRLEEVDGHLLDCPISGTPAMAAAKKSVVYASGDPVAYERVAAILTELSPGVAFVGEFGAGSRMKYVANLLVLVHVAAAGEAMALAAALDLDLEMVVELLSRSPAATSGQFQVRAPLIAAGAYEGRMVTAADAFENLEQITAAAREVGAHVPLATVVRELIERLCTGGDADSDPAKLAALLWTATSNSR